MKRAPEQKAQPCVNQIFGSNNTGTLHSRGQELHKNMGVALKELQQRMFSTRQHVDANNKAVIRSECDQRQTTDLSEKARSILDRIDSFDLFANIECAGTQDNVTSTPPSRLQVAPNEKFNLPHSSQLYERAGTLNIQPVEFAVQTGPMTECCSASDSKKVPIVTSGDGNRFKRMPEQHNGDTVILSSRISIPKGKLHSDTSTGIAARPCSGGAQKLPKISTCLHLNNQWLYFDHLISKVESSHMCSEVMN